MSIRVGRRVACYIRGGDLREKVNPTKDGAQGEEERWTLTL